MEGMRGLAVLLVFFVHYCTLVVPWLPPQSAIVSLADALRTLGHAGVDLFFVLSGYLIYGSLIAKPQPFLRFMSRRVVRIYPAFLVVTCVYVVLSFLFPEQSKMPAELSRAALYLAQNLMLLPGLFPIEALNTVAWSLSYEMFYYLIVPIVIGLLGLRDWTAAKRCALVGAIAIATAIYCAACGGHVRLIMFISGILLYEVLKEGRCKSLQSSPIAFAALLLGLCAMLIPTAGSLGYTLKIVGLFVAFFLLCLTCFGLPASLASNMFRWTPARWLGNMSYSYYLIHGLALKFGFLVFGKIWPASHVHGVLFWVLLAPMFALTLAVSAGLFLAIERPLSLQTKPKRPPVPSVVRAKA